MDTNPTIKNFIIVVLPALLVVFIIFFLVMPKVRENRTGSENIIKTQVTNFEECIAAGNTVMESYPRQCRHGDRTFTENIEPLINEDGAVGVDKDDINERPQTNGKLQAVDCPPEQRNADACIEINQPVCGQVRVECITAPCDPVRETFANSCQACANPRVLSYTNDECLDSDEVKY